MSKRKKSQQKSHRSFSPRTARTSAKTTEKPAVKTNRTALPRDDMPRKSCWLYGRHAVLSALSNRDRRCLRLQMLSSVYKSCKNELMHLAGMRADFVDIEIVEREQLDASLPDNVTHQGIAAEFSNLPAVHIEDICQQCSELNHAIVIVLDQVTDPRNIGAVLRSAAAFGARAVIIQDRHGPGPDHMGALAKAASGALETVKLVRVTNLQRAMKTLQHDGFWCVGLTGNATESLPDAGIEGKTAVIMGSEGDGLRRLVEQSCDRLVKIPMTPDMESLNISNACAITLYELSRQQFSSRPQTRSGIREKE